MSGLKQSPIFAVMSDIWDLGDMWEDIGCQLHRELGTLIYGDDDMTEETSRKCAEIHERMEIAREQAERHWRAWEYCQFFVTAY